MFYKIIRFIRELFKTDSFIPLHEPRFIGNEKKYLSDCIESTYVSSVGPYVGKLEEMVAAYTGAKYAIACVNGTEALHLALMLIGVKGGDEVAVQPLTFVATANAITYTGASPLFIDIDKETLGFSPSKFRFYLEEFAEIRDDGYCYNKKTCRRILACVPMHTFGHPVKIDELIGVCEKYNIKIIEDAAESMGSIYRKKMTGSFGELGILSFNGNKVLTTGGGGMVLTDSEELATRARYLSTQAKAPHKWEFFHDQIGYNYRMPNINAALGCAQLENLGLFIESKRNLAKQYSGFFNTLDVRFFTEPPFCESNYWLNTLIFSDEEEKLSFLEYSNSNQVMTRPAWRLLCDLPMYEHLTTGDIKNARWLEERIVNIPSSVIL